jgi:hypothetical protein
MAHSELLTEGFGMRPEKVEGLFSLDRLSGLLTIVLAIFLVAGCLLLGLFGKEIILVIIGYVLGAVLGSLLWMQSGFKFLLFLCFSILYLLIGVTVSMEASNRWRAWAIVMVSYFVFAVVATWVGWRASGLIKEKKRRMLCKSGLISMLWAPTLMGGHGIAPAPALMVMLMPVIYYVPGAVLGYDAFPHPVHTDRLFALGAGKIPICSSEGYDAVGSLGGLFPIILLWCVFLMAGVRDILNDYWWDRG